MLQLQHMFRYGFGLQPKEKSSFLKNQKKMLSIYQSFNIYQIILLTRRGVFSPANPTLQVPEPLSITIYIHAVISKIKEKHKSKYKNNLQE